VGEPALRDLYGAMHDFGVDRAYLVTTGEVTDAARRWARGKPIAIWDGSDLARMARAAAPAPPLNSAASPAQPSPSPAGPTCPRCGAALVVRRNRRTGEAFLGCSRFPNCRHTQPLPS
jgi:restriction system protein